MLSNYPPGVTGHELEIAGPDWEQDLERTCGVENVELHVFALDDMKAIRATAMATGAQGKGKQRDADVMQRTLRRALSRVLDITVTCPFDGEITVWSYHGVSHWTCPMCGHEHSENEKE